TNVENLAANLSIKSRAGSLIYSGATSGNLNTKKYNFAYIPSGLFTFKDVETLDEPIDVQTQEVYDLYDNLVSNHESLTRESYGKATDNTNMYKYVHEPVLLETDQSFDTPTVVISSGIH